jgi:hypothetical protein
MTPESDDDMPQRLVNVKQDAKDVAFGNLDGPGRHRPELAQLAAQVISEWSLLDTYFSGLFVAMIGANPRPGASVYANFTATLTQAQAMRTVGKLALDAVLYDMLEILLELYRKRGTERNRIGHWVWGHTPDLPDKVLLVEPSHFAVYHAEFANWETAVLRSGNNRLKQPGIRLEHIWVYGKKDFTDISERIQRLISLTGRFRNLVRAHLMQSIGGEKTIQFVVRLNALLKEPEFHACVDRLNAHHQKSQEASPQSRSPNQGEK